MEIVTEFLPRITATDSVLRFQLGDSADHLIPWPIYQ